MRKTVQKMWWSIGLGVLTANIVTGVVLAASANVGIEPAYPVKDNPRAESIFVMTLEPGKTGDNGIRLVNSSDEPHTVEIYPVDSSASVDGSFSCRQKAEALDGVGKWVKLNETKLTLQPNEQKVVDFTVTPPKGTGPGEHGGCIVVQDLADLPAKTGEGILLGFRSAIRLAVTVPGDIIKKLTLEKVDVTRQKDGSYQVSPIARNEGNVSLDVKSYAQLHSIFGQKSVVKSDATCQVMRGVTMACPYTFDGPYWGGIYKAKTSLSYNSDPKSGIGQNMSDQQSVRKDSAWFVAIPDPLAAAAELAVLLIVLWLIITPLRRRLRRKRVIKHWEKYVVKDGDTIVGLASTRGVKWRQIARHNRLKSPYLLDVGRTVIVPKPKPGKKQPRTRKARTTELDWLNETEMTGSVEKPTAIIETAHKPVDVDEIVSTPTQLEQPVAPAQSQSVRTPKPLPAPTDWVNPRQSSYGADDEYDEDYVDWREGADDAELAVIERRVIDDKAVPKLRTQLPTSRSSKSALTKQAEASGKHATKKRKKP